MKLLADENVDGAIVAWLRAAGHDVAWGAESAPTATDREVIERCLVEKRILLTNDLDFGEMVFRQGLTPAGVVLLRLQAGAESDRLARFMQHWPVIEGRSEGNYLVVRNNAVRVRPIPIV